jgi:hypothetical protein
MAHYEGTDIAFWKGVIKKDILKSKIPYSLAFKLGTREEPMAMSGNDLPSLVGK